MTTTFGNIRIISCASSSFRNFKVAVPNYADVVLTNKPYLLHCKNFLFASMKCTVVKKLLKI